MARVKVQGEWYELRGDLDADQVMATILAGMKQGTKGGRPTLTLALKDGGFLFVSESALDVIEVQP